MHPFMTSKHDQPVLGTMYMVSHGESLHSNSLAVHPHVSWLRWFWSSSHSRNWPCAGKVIFWSYCFITGFYRTCPYFSGMQVMVFRRKDNVSVPLESRITSYLTMSSNLIAVYNVLHYIIYVKPNETISNYAKDSTASTHLPGLRQRHQEGQNQRETTQPWP